MNLQKCECKKARIFIPIDWTGEGDPACTRPEDLPEDAPDPPVVKGVLCNDEDGIKEICDGSTIAIKDTYYLEVIIAEEKDANFEVPNDAEVRRAK